MARRPVWPHVASILVMLLAAFAFALLADWAPSALSQAALAGLSLTLVLAAAVLSLPALVARTGLRRWLHWQTQIRFTAAGLPFLAALVILIIAAVNSGNNLVYLVVAALLGALMTSGIFSAFNLSGLSLDVRWPEHAFAGERAPAQLTLENEKHWLPSYSLSVTAASEAADDSGEATMTAVYFAYLPPRRHALARTELLFPRRGYYSATSLVLSTRFPFGLIEKRRAFMPVAENAGVVVYPRVRAEARPATNAPAANGNEEAQAGRGDGQELHRIRPLAPGDSMRHIHWKASAKTGELRVREFSREQDQHLRIVFALAPGQATPQQMERTIEACAQLIWTAAQGGGIWVEFIGCNPARDPLRPQAAQEGLELTPRPAAQALHAVLRYLALVDTSQAPRPWAPDSHRPQRLFLARPSGSTLSDAHYACES